jgi:hypothetical protein
MSARHGGPIRNLVALLLLALVYTDLGDASCDPLWPVRQSGATALATPAGAGQDDEACRDVCVPDCFCCARSLAAGHELAAPAVPGASFDPPPDEHAVPGTRAVPDHPPAA